MHTFKPSNWEAEAGEPCKFKASPGIQRKFKDSQGYYTETPYHGGGVVRNKFIFFFLKKI